MNPRAEDGQEPPTTAELCRRADELERLVRAHLARTGTAVTWAAREGCGGCGRPLIVLVCDAAGPRTCRP